jgi:hypothetical protein
MDTCLACIGTTDLARRVFLLDSGETHIDTIAGTDDEVRRSMCKCRHAVTVMAPRRRITKTDLRALYRSTSSTA